MRTHLLRTFYPSPAAESETGAAANDAEYDPPGDSARLARKTAALTAVPRENALSREDEYALGGYAGI